MSVGLIPYLELLVASTKWLLFLAVSFLYTCLRNLSWVLNGTYWSLLQNQKPENYHCSAHVMQILYKHRLDLFIEGRLSDYLLVHERFEHPEFVLQDDVTFLTITDSHAVFVQSKKGAKPPFKHNFIMLGQFNTADKIITIPLSQFNRLAEEMEGDGGKIVFLQNQSRCGGTLLTSIFLETERCITFNEPHTINALCKYIYVDQIWDKQTAARIFRNTVRMLCKPYRGLKEKPLAYVIKPTVTSIVSTDVIQEVLPEAIQLFIYREPVKVAISLRRLGQYLNTLKLMFYLPNIPYMIAPLFRFIGYCEVDFRGWTPRHSQELEFGYRVASFSMYHYINCREKGIAITGLKYEDLVSHRDNMIGKMFKICQLPDHLVKKATEALDKDSQEDTGFSRKELEKLIPNPPKPNTAFLEAARAMAKEFDVPGPDCWEESFHLPGSIMP